MRHSVLSAPPQRLLEYGTIATCLAGMSGGFSSVKGPQMNVDSSQSNSHDTFSLQASASRCRNMRLSMRGMQLRRPRHNVERDQAARILLLLRCVQIIVEAHGDNYDLYYMARSPVIPGRRGCSLGHSVGDKLKNG